MLPTVAEILALPEVRAGAPEMLCEVGLDRRVRWVHSIDVTDPTDLLQGGELILTTGPGMRRDPRTYIERLADAGVVGVVVELGTDMPAVPDGAVQAARERHLALVALHRVTRFVQVTEEVHRRIVAAQYEEVEFARRTHEVFTHLTMRRAAPPDIVATASALLEAPVVLEDLSHQALAAAPPGGDSAGVLVDWERRSRRHAAAGEGAAPEPWVIEAVGSGEDEWARLIAVRPHPEARRTRTVLERAAQALTMYRMAERGQLSVVRQAQAGLVEDVLRRRVRSEQEALARAVALGMRTGEEYVPAALQLTGWIDAGDPLAIQQDQSLLLETVAQTARAQGCAGLFVPRPGGTLAMVLVLPTGPRPRLEKLEELGRALRRDVAHALGSADLVLGVGTARDTFIGAVAEIPGAAHTAEVAAALPPGDQVVFRVSDIRLRGLVALLRDDPRVQRFAESELGDLVLDDLATGAEGLAVLRGYLELSGNKTLLAQRLHMSRPALYARLARIERVLGVDLDDGESRAALHLAVLVMDTRPAE